MSLAYAYNNTGTVASVTGTVNGATVNEQYRYDALSRLTNYTVTNSGATTTGWYQYDTMGNRVAQKLNSTLTRYSYNSLNELTNSTTYSNPTKTVLYSYDANGNIKTQNVTTTGTVRWTYNWDAANRLLKVTNSTGQSLYAYDGASRLVEAIEGANTWFFSYQGNDILYRYLFNYGNYAYIYSSGIKICVVVNVTWDTYFYHTDALGSTRIITYTDATYVYANNYQPFGQDNGTAQGVYQNRAIDKFTGKPYSASTGLYYYYHRWYDPTIGRFISPDPRPGSFYDPQTLNVYAYVKDSPLNNKDPTGEFIEIAIGAAAGFLIGWGLCGFSFSGSCLEQAGAGALTGAIAGATFGLSLGAMGVGAGVTASLGQALVAGAVSGTISGIASFDINVLLGREAGTAGNLLTDAAIGLVAGLAGGALGDVLGGVKGPYFNPEDVGTELADSGSGAVNWVSREASNLFDQGSEAAGSAASKLSRASIVVIGGGVELGKALVGGIVDPGLHRVFGTAENAASQSVNTIIQSGSSGAQYAENEIESGYEWLTSLW